VVERRMPKTAHGCKGAAFVSLPFAFTAASEAMDELMELDEGLIQHKQHTDTACLHLSPLRNSKMSRMIPFSLP